VLAFRGLDVVPDGGLSASDRFGVDRLHEGVSYP
jgi:hypothetical protein